MKIRSSEDLFDKLDNDYSWRLKEIQYLYMKAKAELPNQIIYIRAGISLLYAHWEGYIKTSSSLYLSYVKSQKKKYSELQRNFLVISFIDKLKSYHSSNYFSESFFLLMNDLLDNSNKRVYYDETKLIETKSNLTSDVLKSILLVIGFNKELYELQKKSYR